MREKWTLEGRLSKCLEKIEENRNLSVELQWKPWTQDEIHSPHLLTLVVYPECEAGALGFDFALMCSNGFH